MRLTGILRRAVVPVALAGMLTLAGAALGRIYADDLLFYLAAGAAVGSVGVGVAARRLPSWAAAPLSTVLLTGYLALALHLAAGATGLTVAVARDALTNGIPRLLTAMIPVEATPDTVVIAVAAIWIAGLAATEVAVRSGRVLLGCVPPVAAYAGALYVVGPNAEAATAYTLIFAGLIVAALAAASGAPGSTIAAVRVRALGGAAAGLVVVVGLIAAAGPWVGDRVSATPVDPRQYVQPPRVDSLDESPLNRISGWALYPNQPLLEFRPGDPENPAPLPVPSVPSVTESTATPAKSRKARTTTSRSSAPASGQGGGAGTASADSGAVAGQGGGAGIVPIKAPATSSAPAEPAASARGNVRLRLAVLSDYDGVTWRVGGVYRNAGRVLPVLDVPAGTEVTENEHQITITGLTGRLLPAVPTPTRITGARVAYDAATGTLIRPEGLTEGLRYTAVSEVQKPDLNLLPAANVPSGDAFARYLAPGAGAPEQVQKLAEHLAEGNGAPYDRAVAIEDFLAEHYRHVADAPSGHAYPNLGHFLFGRRDAGGQKGTSEQFAAAYAVLARMTGLPSRVVVGFVAPAAGGAVTAGDALAWPEVYFDQVGWVAFDPLPKSDETRPVEEDFTPPTPSPPPSQSENPEPTEAGSSAPPPEVAAPAATAGTSTVLVASGTSGGVLLLLTAAAGTIVALRGAQRRRRLTIGDPGQRIAGAWLELTDALRLAGRPVPDHLSATEAARHAAVLPRPVQRTGLLRRAVPPTAEEIADARAAQDEAGPLIPVTKTGTGSPPANGAMNGATNAATNGATSSATNGAANSASNEASTADAQAAPLPPLDALVEAINTAGFAPGAADTGQAERAGSQVIAYADALRERRSWWRRLWWSVRPGPLRWNRESGDERPQ
ncbi:transglutaminase domain-containing protein [Actinoplanes derwentensis]|uniref:Transglutaminase-like superfamily protein n=2 Tax=Actinoplanes derwentensis TaxID=113562 RepID=A0A1H2B4L3_9ACTN|nr:transglutaminase domain-containing protein [Actinoplanes derwentensis]GID87652.1 hypothetical protein Ade03nite_65760 [Actinoplanes derwentensis]SDT53128.1 Transglutaminase-like superfamily protein [Actinoplanes derwentensis]